MACRSLGSVSGPRNVGFVTNSSSPPRLAPRIIYFFVRTPDHCEKQYTSSFKRRDPSVAQKVMYAGNGNKSLQLAVKSSLERLRTTYIDLLYVHWWDYDTSVEEVMRSLHALVAAGKVLYLVCGHVLSLDYSFTFRGVSRVSLILLHGLSQRRINTLGIML